MEAREEGGSDVRQKKKKCSGRVGPSRPERSFEGKNFNTFNKLYKKKHVKIQISVRTKD